MIVNIIFGIITMIFIFRSSGKPKETQDKLFWLYLPIIAIYIIIKALNGSPDDGTMTLFVGRF